MPTKNKKAYLRKIKNLIFQKLSKKGQINNIKKSKLKKGIKI